MRREDALDDKRVVRSYFFHVITLSENSQCPLCQLTLSRVVFDLDLSRRQDQSDYGLERWVTRHE